MLRTKNLITRFEELDELWAFEYFLRPFGLTEKLQGQSINIPSPFKKEDTPSFFLFNENNRYFFKCFASDLGGDVYTLAQHLLNKANKADAIDFVWGEYENFLNGNGKTWELNSYSDIQYTKKVRFHIKDVELRGWNEHDKEFWQPFYVNRTALEDHNVAALSKIIMNKVSNEGVSDFIIENRLMYGFFSKTGELYKIYQPGRKKGKYLRVRDYIQGLDQLSDTNEHLIVKKALKDIMCFKALQIPNWDALAPNSEGELFHKDFVSFLKGRYKKIYTLFDTDSAGKKASAKWQNELGIPPLPFDMGYKDLSDTMKELRRPAVKPKIELLLNS